MQISEATPCLGLPSARARTRKCANKMLNLMANWAWWEIALNKAVFVEGQQVLCLNNWIIHKYLKGKSCAQNERRSITNFIKFSFFSDCFKTNFNFYNLQVFRFYLWPTLCLHLSILLPWPAQLSPFLYLIRCHVSFQIPHTIAPQRLQLNPPRTHTLSIHLLYAVFVFFTLFSGQQQTLTSSSLRVLLLVRGNRGNSQTHLVVCRLLDFSG